MRALFWRAAAGGPTQVEASAEFQGVATLTPTWTALQLADSTIQGVALITETWTALQLEAATLEGVAILEPTFTALQLAESTLSGVGTIAADGEDAGSYVAESPSGPRIATSMVGYPGIQSHPKPRRGRYLWELIDEDEEEKEEAPAAKASVTVAVEASSPEWLVPFVLIEDD